MGSEGRGEDDGRLRLCRSEVTAVSLALTRRPGYLRAVCQLLVTLRARLRRLGALDCGPSPSSLFSAAAGTSSSRPSSAAQPSSTSTPAAKSTQTRSRPRPAAHRSRGVEGRPFTARRLVAPDFAIVPRPLPLLRSPPPRPLQQPAETSLGFCGPFQSTHPPLPPARPSVARHEQCHELPRVRPERGHRHLCPRRPRRRCGHSHYSRCSEICMYTASVELT